MLRFTAYRFRFTALDEIRLQAYPGSALRGIFGHGLRRSACITNLARCQECSLRQQCAYTKLFETQVAAGHKGLSLQPLVMSLGQYLSGYQPGECLELGMTLIGQANRYLTYLITAWQRAGQRGLGKANARFAVAEISLLQPTGHSAISIYNQAEGLTGLVPEPVFWTPSVQAIPEQVQLRFITPCRSKKDGRLVTPANFEPRGFLIALVRRIEALRAQHDPDSLALDIQALIQATARVQMSQAKLEWTEVTRRSSRQQTEMQLGGVTGSMVLSGAGLEQLYPLLELGQWLHVGKNTLFGLGQYVLKEIHNG